MQVLVKRIINSPINSNCYIIYQQGLKNCIVVDPGTQDCIEIINFLSSKKLTPEFIILTHEHFDHIGGVNKLKIIFDCKIVTNKLCAEKIINCKKNMSIFFDQKGFETFPADIIIESIDKTLMWNDTKIEFIDTPGHTNCSISFLIGNRIFIGDLMIYGYKTVTKLPSGNKNTLLNSLNYIYNHFCSSNKEIYPGHGETFILDDININEFY